MQEISDDHNPPAESAVEALATLRGAVRRGDLATVRGLVTADPGLARAASSRGGSLALEAFEREHSDVADFLFAARDGGSMVSLDVHEAASLGRPAALRHALTEDMLCFEEVGPAGFLPLHRAAYRGHVDATLLLLEAGAEADRASENGARLTALHSALAGAARFVAQGAAPGGSPAYAEVVRVLLAAGADPERPMEGGWTARTAAERDGLEGLVPRASAEIAAEGAPEPAPATDSEA